MWRRSSLEISNRKGWSNPLRSLVNTFYFSLVVVVTNKFKTHYVSE